MGKYAASGAMNEIENIRISAENTEDKGVTAPALKLIPVLVNEPEPVKEEKKLPTIFESP